MQECKASRMQRCKDVSMRRRTEGSGEGRGSKEGGKEGHNERTSEGTNERTITHKRTDEPMLGTNERRVIRWHLFCLSVLQRFKTAQSFSCPCCVVRITHDTTKLTCTADCCRSITSSHFVTCLLHLTVSSVFSWLLHSCPCAIEAAVQSLLCSDRGIQQTNMRNALL